MFRNKLVCTKLALNILIFKNSNYLQGCWIPFHYLMQECFTELNSGITGTAFNKALFTNGVSRVAFTVRLFLNLFTEFSYFQSRWIMPFAGAVRIGLWKRNRKAWKILRAISHHNQLNTLPKRARPLSDWTDLKWNFEQLSSVPPDNYHHNDNENAKIQVLHPVGMKMHFNCATNTKLRRCAWKKIFSMGKTFHCSAVWQFALVAGMTAVKREFWLGNGPVAAKKRGTCKKDRKKTN